MSGSRATLEAVAALPGAVTVMKGQLEEHQAALAELRSKMESVSAAAAVPPAEKAPSAAAEPEELRRLQVGRHHRESAAPCATPAHPWRGGGPAQSHTPTGPWLPAAPGAERCAA
mmetsp:Transcript_2146/g.5377  ORF Transcript_2146/g.5377 Transcript_2146/m.5377 type:complete len:115 (+) Transcript_2146:339-683(+)